MLLNMKEMIVSWTTLVMHSLIILFITSVSQTAQANSKVIVCYFTNWAQYRDGLARQLPKDLPPHLCTHYVFAFAKIPMGQNRLEAVEWNDISELYPGMMALKNQNPNLKITLAIGGWTHGVAPFSMMTQS